MVLFVGCILPFKRLCFGRLLAVEYQKPTKTHLHWALFYMTPINEETAYAAESSVTFWKIRWQSFNRSLYLFKRRAMDKRVQIFLFRTSGRWFELRAECPKLDSVFYGPSMCSLSIRLARLVRRSSLFNWKGFFARLKIVRVIEENAY